jgi:preprotein translocase subunit Sss1
VWIIGVAAYLIARRAIPDGNFLSVDDPNLAALVAILDVLVLVMFVLWVAALARLARQQDWGWFTALLVLQLVGLGIIGMVAYAIAGPIDIDLSKPGISS